MFTKIITDKGYDDNFLTQGVYAGKLNDSFSNHNIQNNKVMKKLRAMMDRYFDKLNAHWRKLPVPKQHQYTLYFFVGYLLLTAGVIGKVLYDKGKPNDVINIRHIENPILKKHGSPAILQDTVSTFKNRIYERK